MPNSAEHSRDLISRRKALQLVFGAAAGVLVGCGQRPDESPPQTFPNPATQPDSYRLNPARSGDSWEIPEVPTTREGKLQGRYKLSIDQAVPGEVFVVALNRDNAGNPTETTYCSYVPASRNPVCDKDFEKLKEILKGRGIQSIVLLN